MKWLTTNIIKKHLNIEPTFTDDDDLLEVYADTAEQIVEQELQTSLDNIAKDNKNGSLPTPIKQAMLIMIANFYSQRESFSSLQVNAVPRSVDYLLSPYHKYTYSNL